ncbi:MASE1 domain-containing protein [Dyella agri]
MPLCGFHLCVLLLAPYRYWPALLVGETCSLAYLSYVCADQLGLAWATVNVIPSAVVAMPIVYLCRERWRLFPERNTASMGMLLGASLLVTCAMTLNNLVLLSTIRLPPGYPSIHYDQVVAQWVLGNYLGILTLAPLVLAVRQSLAGLDVGALQRKLAESRLLLESILLLAPVLIFLIWVGLHAEQAREIVQVAMFLPVVWLALRHGWEGAAVGGTGASIAVMVLMPQSYDPDTLQAEVVIAVVISAMLLVGARITAFDHRARQERDAMRALLTLAQRNVHVSEMQLRMTSHALERIRETVHTGYTLMMERLRYLHPALDDHRYRNRELVAQDQIHRLADSLYPVSWRERGLLGALREGIMVRALDEAGITYWCDLRGPLSLLSLPIHLAIYRLVCETVAQACAKRDVSAFCVRVRCGRMGGGRQFAVLQIDARGHPSRVGHIRWHELLQRLRYSTCGFGRQAIDDRAATFEGRSRERVLPDGRRTSVILFDPE